MHSEMHSKALRDAAERATHWEVDDRRVLLNLLLRVLGEALDMHDQVLGQPSELVPALVAVHHLLRRVPVEL